MKVLLFTIFLTLAFSCSKNRTYVRHTDLHHTNSIKIEDIRETKDSIELTLNYGDSDTPTTEFYTFNLEDTNFTYIKNKKVIQLFDSYYIRKNVRNKKINETYYNRDVEF